MKRRCLVVDDDEMVRVLIRLCLPSEDFEIVAEATNRVEAVEAAASARPDLVLIDLVLARDDGLATIADVRAILPDASIVVLSGMPVDKVESACLSAGADHYLTKSVVGEISGVLTGLLGPRTP